MQHQNQGRTRKINPQVIPNNPLPSKAVKKDREP